MVTRPDGRSPTRAIFLAIFELSASIAVRAYPRKSRLQRLATQAPAASASSPVPQAMLAWDGPAAASGLLMPSADFADSARIMEELGGQMREHSAELFKTAQIAMADMFCRALSVATGRGRPDKAPPG